MTHFMNVMVKCRLHNNQIQITIYNTVILVRRCYKLFGLKFSLYREGSSLFRFNFVPSFIGGQNKI